MGDITLPIRKRNYLVNYQVVTGVDERYTTDNLQSTVVTHQMVLCNIELYFLNFNDYIIKIKTLNYISDFINKIFNQKQILNIEPLANIYKEQE